MGVEDTVSVDFEAHRRQAISKLAQGQCQHQKVLRASLISMDRVSDFQRGHLKRCFSCKQQVQLIEKQKQLITHSLSTPLIRHWQKKERRELLWKDWKELEKYFPRRFSLYKLQQILPTAKSLLKAILDWKVLVAAAIAAYLLS